MKKQRGITLIALVITIVVLLILSGVTIATLTGTNGILTQANKAAKATTKEAAREKLNLAVAGIVTQKLKNNETLILNDEFATKLADNEDVTSAIYNGSTIDAEVDGYSFEVNEDFGINDGITYEKVEPTNIDDWEYTVENGKAIITKYKGTDTKVVIPNYIDGYWVKQVGSGEYNEKIWDESICEYINEFDSFGCYVQNTITEIVISEGITKIGSYAFVYSKALEKVEIPRTVTSIGDCAFYLSFKAPKPDNNLKVLSICNNVIELGYSIFCGRDGITINVEYTEEEIETKKEDGSINWEDSWTANSIWYWQKGKSIICTTTINYGVTMD